MKIENKSLAKALFGAVRIEEDEGFLFPFRFSKRQLERRQGEEGYLIRARSASCMTIDFYTDATQLEFDYRVRIGSGKKLCFFDIRVNDRLMFHTGKMDILEDAGHIAFDMSEGMKRVTVYLPCLYETKIGNFCITDGAVFEPVKKEKKILFLGDSITQGYSSDCPSLCYANQIVRKYDAICVNQAIGGSMFNEDYLDGEILPDADMVLVAYGTNDWAGGVDIEGNATAYMNKLVGLYPNSRVYMILPIWRKDQDRENAVMTFDEARQVVKRVGESIPGVTVIDGINFVPHDTSLYEDGRVHPGDIGFMCYAEELGKALEEHEAK
ncbi:MAG: SGNH/GDSL hydrolase family protein [Lachnospiraceae bacterium]|nr:SGNH/GDSL hydrolase family protein [Lachnospiraceae bacterium]